MPCGVCGRQFFLDETHGPGRYESMLRILFIYAKLNPGVRYVQGARPVVCHLTRP
jgi:hypothetical protein